jgi:diguanylate cyclase (GGDEF)-like protein
MKDFWTRLDPSLRLTVPLVLLAVAVIAMLNVSIIALGARADRQGADWEQGYIVSGMNAHIERDIQVQVETLSRMDPFNPITPPAAMRVLVVDADGSPIAVRTGSQVATLGAWSVARIARPALSQLAGASSVGSSGMSADTLTSSTAVWLGGEPELVVAVRSLHPSARAKGLTIVGTTNLSQDLGEWAQQRNLKGFRMARPGALEAGEAFAPLRVRGEPTAMGLQWQPKRIGYETIVRSLPMIWAVTLVLLLIGGVLMHRTLRLARSLVASEAHAHHLALHDPMTGLGNRALFNDRLDHALELRGRSGEMMAVACIDLDRFKHVNDTLGHQAGDAMIKEAARRISNVTRSSDTVARLGGDEFAIILYPISGRAGLDALCARLTEALSARLDLPSGQASLSASVGVTIVGAGMDGADAVRQADLALYRAKQQGRGRFVLFEAEMDESLKLRVQIEDDLRTALETSALKVHYQPQYTSRGALEGVEALVRWDHPERGSIGPDYFIPIAEEAGLIHELGEFVVAQALAAAARWPTLKMAINVSPLQLQRIGFVDRCCALAAEHGVDPSRIELEITEGVLLENEPRVQNSLRALRNAGFKLALDDFGTGYSSLSYLNVYPVDKIKIDRSFVSNLGVEEGDADKVVRAIIRLGRVLGLSVTAEGVETEAQRQKLIAAGCHSLQGYLHGRPGEVEIIDELVRVQKAEKAFRAA